MGARAAITVLAVWWLITVLDAAPRALSGGDAHLSSGEGTAMGGGADPTPLTAAGAGGGGARPHGDERHSGLRLHAPMGREPARPLRRWRMNGGGAEAVQPPAAWAGGGSNAHTPAEAQSGDGSTSVRTRSQGEGAGGACILAFIDRRNAIR